MLSYAIDSEISSITNDPGVVYRRPAKSASKQDDHMHRSVGWCDDSEWLCLHLFAWTGAIVVAIFSGQVFIRFCWRQVSMKDLTSLQWLVSFAERDFPSKKKNTE